MSSLLQLPFPGELLWSALARLKRRFSWLGSATITRKAGFNSNLIGIFFPCRLQAFAENLAHSRKPTAEQLLRRDTLFPFVAPFFLTMDSRLLRHSMLVRGFTDPHLVQHCHLALGLSAWFQLRYCPACARDDAGTEHYGAPAWRAWHQLAALEICPRHRCDLVLTPVTRRTIRYVALAEVLTNAPPIPSKSRLQSAIADGASDLLGNPHHEIGPERLCVATRDELARTRGSLNPSQLLAELEATYPRRDLAWLGSSEERHRWVTQMLGGANLPLRLEHYAALCALCKISLRELLHSASRSSETLPRRWFMARLQRRRAAAVVPAPGRRARDA